MALEIEHKFLVKDCWQPQDSGEYMLQGYIADSQRGAGRLSVRVRIVGERAYLNLKSRISSVSRHEYEYLIPLDDARELLKNFAGPLVEKTRYKELHDGKCWEIDVFAGDNAGLIVAELELDSETASFERPDWLGAEVTADDRYLNTSLAVKPYKLWDK